MGSIKYRNGMDLTEADVTRIHRRGGNNKKRWQEYTEEVAIIRRGGKNTQKNSTKKIFMTQIITVV